MGGERLRASRLLVLVSGAIFIAAVVTVLGLSIAPRFKKIEHRETANTRAVEKTLPITVERLTHLIKSKQFLQGSPYQGFDVFTATDNTFPDDFQLNAFAASDPGLKRYAGLPASMRKNDLYLVSYLDSYWPSTYFYDGSAAKFSCKFILHLEPAGNQTKIEVFEYQPEIWVGEEFVLLGHHGPDFYYDIRFVEPTAKDRIELLDRIASVVMNP